MGQATKRRACFLLLVVVGTLVLCDRVPRVGAQTQADDGAVATETAEDNPVATRKAIFETPYLCRLGKRYPWIRTFVDERLSLFAHHVERRETGGNPRLIVFEGSEIKTLFHFEDDHKDVEGIFKVSETLHLDQGWDSFEFLSGSSPAAFARSFAHTRPASLSLETSQEKLEL